MPGAANADVRLRTQKEAVVALLVENALKHDEVQFSRFQLGQQVRGVVHQKEQFVLWAGQITVNFREKNVIADGLRRPNAQQQFRLFVQRCPQRLLLVAQGNGIPLQKLPLGRFA